MSRPIGTYKKNTQRYADYLKTIDNLNSKNKARHILAKLYYSNIVSDNLSYRIRVFCHYLSDNNLRQTSIKAYLLELLKYILFLDNKELLNALYYYADSNLLEMSDSKLWAKHRPQNSTLPID